MDPRKPIIRPDQETQNAVRAIAENFMTEATLKGTHAIGCTGASFVMLGLGIWMKDLHEIDPRATSQMLLAMSIIHDPASSEKQKAQAEKSRQQAVETIYSAVDLLMNPASGTA